MKKLLLLFVLQLFHLSIIGQTIIKGKIQDASESIPLAGVSIYEKGTNNGTISNLNGDFSLLVDKPDMAIIVISFLGYKKQEINFGKNQDWNIQLNQEDQRLEEIVVTALGINRPKRALGFSVQKLDSKDINEIKESNLSNALAGKIAGVQTTNGASGVGSSSRIVIRGESSLSGSNQPLIVVDGVPISNELIANDTENLEADFQEVDYGNGLGELNSEDIASINVLKGPGAAALYGTRAANGVIIISTKDGSFEKKGLSISLNHNTTFETPVKFPQYQNIYGQGAGGEFAYEDGIGAGTNDGGIVSFGPRMDGQLITQFDSPSTNFAGEAVRGGDIISRGGNQITATPFNAKPNNIRNFFQTGTTLQNGISISKNAENSAFRISFNRMDNKGIIPNTDLTRNGLSISAKQQLNNKLSARIFANYINSSSTHRPGLGYGSENPMYLFTWMGRQANVESLQDYWQDGQEGFSQFNYNYKWMDNPYFNVYENTNGFNKNRFLGNVALNYQLNEKLGIRFRSGMDYYHDLRESKRAFSTQRFKNGAYREDEVSFREMNTDLMATYKTAISDNFILTISAGGNQMSQSIDYKNTRAGELSVPGIYNFGNSKIPLVIGQQKTKKKINSLYGIVNVGLGNSLFLDLNIRNDWSSTLPSENNSFAYYSGSIAWLFSENFELPGIFSYGKLRLSAASVGNDTNPFQLKNTFVFNENYGTQALLSNSSTLLNAALKPERLNALELGTELWFFKDRFGIDFSWYQNISKDQIINLPASASSGYPERVVNGGKIRSRGIELVLQGTPVYRKNFAWKTYVNFSKNESRILELPEGIDQYVTGFSSVYNSTENRTYFIASPDGKIGDIYGTGILQENGQDVYDSNGIPVRDGQLKLLGNYNPDFMLGFGNEIRIKDFTLNVLFDWRHGGTIVSRTLSIASTSGVLESTLPGREEGIIGEGVTNIGSIENPNYVANTASISAADYYGQYYNRANEANALYDASYLKLRQLSLGYEISPKFTEKLGIEKIRLAIVGSNLFVWTENPHFDPELSTMQGRNFAYGVEDMSYPSTRSVGFSVGLKF